MNPSNELKKSIADHLAKIRPHLGNLPPDEQAEILQSVEAHIYDALQTKAGNDPSLSDLEAILAEMDPPESYGDLPLAPQKKKLRRKLAIMLCGLAAVALTVAGLKEWKNKHPKILEHWEHSGKILKGVGVDAFHVGASRDELISALGIPDESSTDTWLQWKDKCVHALVDKHRGALELRFDIGFQGTTSKGIQIGSSEKDVLAAYGNPDRITTNNQAKMMEWSSQGISVWLTPKNGVHQIVVFRPYVPPSKQPMTDSNASPVGRWVSVDFVSAPEQFNPQVKAFPGDLYLKRLTFLPGGTTDRPYWTWKKGILHHSGDNTDAKFFIKQIDGEDYLFMEWISGDVMLREQPPKYYVLKREDLKIAPPSQLNPVAFEQTPHIFKTGDDIVLDEVLCSSPDFKTGDTVTIKGRYTLASQPEATLLLTCTGGRSSTKETQRKSVTQGSGDFELTYVIPYPGCSHLAFYDKVTHKSFGNLWFGTKKQVEEIEPTRKSMQSADKDNDTAQIEKADPVKQTATPPNQSNATLSPPVSRKTAQVQQHTGEQLEVTQEKAIPIETEFNIQATIDDASPGNTITIPPGTYTQPIVIRKMITLKGQDAVFKVKTNQPAIQIDTSKEVILKNIEIQCKTTSTRQKGDRPYAIYCSGGNLLIENCTIKALGNFTESPCGILADNQSHLIIRDCRFHGFNYAIEANSRSEASIENSLILHPGHCGIIINGSSGTLNRNIISGANAHGIRCTAGKIEADSNLVVGSRSCGFYIGNRSSAGTLSNNLIIDNGVGINVFAWSKLDIANNVIINSTRTGAAISDTATLSFDDNIISDNEKGVLGFATEKDKKPKIKLNGKNLLSGNTIETENIDLPSKTLRTDPQFTDPDSGLFATGGNIKGMGLTDPAAMQVLWKKWKTATTR